MQNARKLFFRIMFVIAAQGYSCSYAMGSGETINLAYETLKTSASEGLGVFFGSVSWIGLTTNVYSLGKDAKEYFSPSQETQTNEEEKQDKVEMMQLRKKLRDCFKNHRTSTERDSHGVPTECAEITLKLGAIGAWAEVERMTNIFNQFSK